MAYSIPDTGWMLGDISQNHVRNLLDAKVLEKVQIGRRVMVTAASIKRLVEAGGTKSTRRRENESRALSGESHPPGASILSHAAVGNDAVVSQGTASTERDNKPLAYGEGKGGHPASGEAKKSNAV